MCTKNSLSEMKLYERVTEHRFTKKNNKHSRKELMSIFSDKCWLSGSCWSFKRNYYSYIRFCTLNILSLVYCKHKTLE